MISLAIEDAELIAAIPEQRAWVCDYLQGRRHSDQRFYADLHPSWFGYELIDSDSLIEACPRTRSWLDSHGLTVRHLALITLEAHHTSPLHRDRLLPEQDPWALNINISNCEQTWTEAYEVYDRNGHLCSSSEGDQLRFFRADPQQLIARWNLATPRLFNTQIAHRVVNDTAELRTALSYRFWQNPLRQLA